MKNSTLKSRLWNLEDKIEQAENSTNPDKAKIKKMKSEWSKMAKELAKQNQASKRQKDEKEMELFEKLYG